MNLRYLRNNARYCTVGYALGIYGSLSNSRVSVSLVDRLITCFGADADTKDCKEALAFALSKNGNSLTDTRLVARILAFQKAKADGDGKGKSNGESTEPKDSEPSQKSNSGTSLQGSDAEQDEQTEDFSDLGIDFELEKSPNDGDGCGDESEDHDDDCGAPIPVKATDENLERGDDTQLSEEQEGKEKTDAPTEIKDALRDSSSPKRGRISTVVYADSQKAYTEALKLTGKGRLAATLLARMVRKYAVGNTETAPRWNTKKVVHEIVSRRLSIPKMRGKNNQAKRPCLIMVDVSGSCSAFSHECLVAALACHLAMPKMVTVVWHTNGSYVSHLGYLESVEETTYEKWGRFNETGIAYWQHTWGLVFNFGDADAYDELRHVVAAGSQLMWLDSYGKNGGFRPAKTETEQLRTDWKSPNVTKYNGCGSLEDFLSVLKKMS